MPITLAAGRNARIGIKPNTAGRIYGAGYLYLVEMSAESSLEFNNSVTEQEVYGAQVAKAIGGQDAATFSFTAFVTNTTGQVHRIVVTNGGSGYTSAPSVSIAAPPTGGVQATAIAEVTNGTVSAVWITHFGEGYTSAPAVSFSGGGGSGAAATASINGLSDFALDDMLRNLYLRIEFSPGGNSPGMTRYTFDFVRESYSINPAVNGVVSVQASGRASNITKDTWT